MKKRYPVIGFTGAAGCGKDTAADVLQGKHRFLKLSFAEPLYDMVSIVTRTPVEVLKTRAGKEVTLDRIGVSPRKMLQTLGTEWGREMVSPDIWIKHLEGRLHSIEKRTGLLGLVIPDVRFQNEVDFVHELGGEVWRIDRPENPNAISSGHSSELSPLGVDDLIVNIGSLEQFQKLVLLKFVDYLGV